MDPDVRRALGVELRRRRLALSLTQQELGAPLTRAYVSAVESGRIVPSLPALRHMTDRLQVPLSAFFDVVERAVSNGT
jgi:transcriptional regulator with XRE-family HTH domain